VEINNRGVRANPSQRGIDVLGEGHGNLASQSPRLSLANDFAPSIQTKAQSSWNIEGQLTLTGEDLLLGNKPVTHDHVGLGEFHDGHEARFIIQSALDGIVRRRWTIK